MNTKNQIESLIETGIVTLPSNIPTSDLKAMRNIQKMLITEKEAFEGAYCSDFESLEQDRGLFRRESSKEQGKKDNKWCFHYRRTLLSELERKHGRELPKEELIYQLCMYGERVYAVMEAQVSRLINGLDKIFPKYNIAEECFHPWAQDLTSVRGIAYDAPEANQNVAAYHFDRGFISGAIYESHPGLNFIINGEKTPHTYREGYVTFFLGEKAEKLTFGKLKAVVHGVDVLEKGIQRDAIVFFKHSLRPHLAHSTKVSMS